MPDVTQIKQALSQRFQGAEITVLDDSAKHAGHAGARPEGGSHFTVKVTSSEFKGLNPVARHRLIYAVLNPLFAEGLHALAIEASVPK